MQEADALARVQAHCTAERGARAIICGELFERSWYEMARFFRALLERPMVFTQAQKQFYARLQRAGAFVQEEPQASLDTATVQLVGADYARHGTLFYAVVPFVEAICQLFVEQSPLHAVAAFDQLPCALVSAVMFYTRDRATWPLREWFVRRFYQPTCADAQMWLRSHMQLLLTPEMLDLAFHDTAARQCDQRLMTARGHIHYRQTLVHTDYATFDTHSGVVQNAMDQSMPRKTVAFYTYFMSAMVLQYAAERERNALVSLGDSVAHVQRYWEVCLAMLLAQPMPELLPLIAAVPPATRQLLAQIAEQMREFLVAPTNGGVELVRSIYMRTLVYDQNWLVNQAVREMLLRRSNSERRLLELFYVPVNESPLCSLLDTLVSQQVVQLSSLSSWLWRQFDLSLVSLLRPDRTLARQAADARFYVCRFPTNAGLNRVRWTVEYWQRACPQLFGELTDYTFSGLDVQNNAYMIMPRRTADAVRLVSLCDALTLRNFRKMVAVYPLLMRLYLTSRQEASPGETLPGTQVSLDHLSLLTAVHVLGYWLCVPQQRGSDVQALYEREGMIPLGGAIDAMSSLHSVVRALYRGAVMRDAPALLATPHRYDVTRNMSLLNGVRSFLMIMAPHDMSVETLLRVRSLSALCARDPDWEWFVDALRALPVPTAAAAVTRAAPVRRAGRPRSQPAQQQQHARAQEQPRVSNELLGEAAVLDRLHADNPLRLLTPADRVHLFNVWFYDFVVHALAEQPLQQEALLADYQAQTPPLSAEDYRRSKYICPTDFVQAWQASNQFFCDMHVSRYPSNAMCLRPQVAARCTDGGSDEFIWLLLLMQQLERYICLSDASRRNAPAQAPSGAGFAPAQSSSSSSSRRAGATRSSGVTPADATAVDAGMVAAVTRVYTNPERLLSTMPVACYFDRRHDSYQLTAYETAWCMADATAPSAPPQDACADTSHLSQIAMDVMTAYGSMFDEARITQPESCYRLLRDTQAYEQSMVKGGGGVVK